MNSTEQVMYNHICSLQRANREFNNENKELRARISELEAENRRLMEELTPSADTKAALEQEVKCSVCSGVGSIQCGYDYTGIVTRPCSHCRGTGRVHGAEAARVWSNSTRPDGAEPAKDVRCKYCNGQGVYGSHSEWDHKRGHCKIVTCKWCGGTGRAKTQNPYGPHMSVDGEEE